MTIRNHIKKALFYLIKKANKMTDEERKRHYIYDHVPKRVRLEASTFCQLRYTGCGFQKGRIDNLGRGFLTIDNFK